MNHRRSDEWKKTIGTFRPSRAPKFAVVGKLNTVPAPPKTLSPSAREEWKRLARIAVGQGTLRHSDLRGFALLCTVLADATELRRAIDRDGHLLSGKANPLVRMLDAATSQALRWLAAYGLTPAGGNHVIAALPKKKSVLQEIAEIT